MNILIASDNNYVSPALVLINSIFRNHINEKIHVFYMFYQLSKKI